MVDNESSTGGTTRQFSVGDLAGTYAFRFSGNSIRSSVLFRLSGVGRFQISEQGKLTGQHRSSITALQGQGAKLTTAKFQLDGQVTLDSDGTGSANIRFRSTDAGSGDVDGDFHLVVAGAPDRIWFVSAGSKTPDGDLADELVDMEAIRIANAQ
jgi:hypothetical protein